FLSSHCRLYKPLVCGDSQTAGSGVIDAHDRYADKLFNSDYTKFNMAAAGSTRILQLLNWQPELISNLHPTYVINNFGYNDNLNGTGNFGAKYDSATARWIRGG